MRTWVVVVLLAMSTPALGSPGGDFAREYINTLSAIEIARQKAAADLGTTANEKLASCIRGGTAQQLELDSSAQRLREYKLPGEMKGIPNTVADAFTARSETFGEIIKSCEIMVEGPRKGVDYGKVAANVPKLNARLDFIDKTIFQGSPIVMMALIDEKPDANGKMSRLNISCKEKVDLIRLISVSFSDINKKNPTYIVGAAQMMRDWLKTSKHTCAPAKL